MSLFKRGKTWWIDFTTPGGERTRCSTQTEDKSQAQELHDQLKAEGWRVYKLGEKPQRTWDEAELKWLSETEHKRSHMQDVKQVQWLQQFFRGRMLSELTREVIADGAAIKRKEASDSTSNRYLAMIRAILRRAALEWEWMERVPLIRLYPEPKRRVRWLTPEQAAALLAELPEHLADVVRFSIATGLRRRNVVDLEWSQVDLARKVAWIYADQAKGGRDIHVSLNATAIEVLTKQIGKHQERVFSFRGRPINQVNTKAWKQALKRAAIAKFRWHDLRHTWASWLTQNGVPLNVIQEMGAWQSVEMVRRYAHLAPEQFGQHAKVVDKLLNGTSTSQSSQQPKDEGAASR
jgi:integrase